MAAAGRRRARRRRKGGLSLGTLLGLGAVGLVVLGLGVVIGQTFADRSAVQTELTKQPPIQAEVSTALPEQQAGSYPAKTRLTDSPWGCAAFDLDTTTPVALAGPAVELVVLGADYRLVTGEVTDTVIPALEAFSHCLDKGQPEQTRRTPIQRQGLPAARTTAFQMGPLQLQALPPPGTHRVAIEVVRSRPDPSPYLEALAVYLPFGGVWLFEHGAQTPTMPQVSVKLGPARCLAAATSAAVAPSFGAAGAMSPAYATPAPALDGPRRRRLDLSVLASAVPAAAAARTRSLCTGTDCPDDAVLRAENPELAAAQFCDLGGAIWRIQVEGEVTHPNPQSPDRPYRQRFTVFLPLEPPALDRAGPLYLGPRGAGVTLRGRADAPYAFALPAVSEQAVRFSLAAAETSTHLLRAVAYDINGQPIGQSRWMHALLFSPQGALAAAGSRAGAGSAAPSPAAPPGPAPAPSGPTNPLPQAP